MSRSNYFSRAATYKPRKKKTSLLVILTLIGVLLTLCAYLLNNVEDNQPVAIEEHLDDINLINLNEDQNKDHPAPNNVPDLATNEALADATYIIEPAIQTNSASISIEANPSPEGPLESMQ